MLFRAREIETETEREYSRDDESVVKDVVMLEQRTCCPRYTPGRHDTAQRPDSGQHPYSGPQRRD